MAIKPEGDSGKLLIYLLMSGPIALVLAAILGAVFRFDGQSAFLALPFILIFWLASPVSIIWTFVIIRRKVDIASPSIFVALAVLNTALLLACLVFFLR